jgi:hypothetical protein
MITLITIITSVVTIASLVCSFVPTSLLPDNAKKVIKILALNFNNVHYDCNHKEG